MLYSVQENQNLQRTFLSKSPSDRSPSVERLIGLVVYIYLQNLNILI